MGLRCSWLGRLPLREASVAIAALQVIEREPELVARLWQNVEQYLSGLKKLGFDTAKSVTPMNDRAAGGMSKYGTYLAPTTGYSERRSSCVKAAAPTPSAFVVPSTSVRDNVRGPSTSSGRSAISM